MHAKAETLAPYLDTNLLHSKLDFGRGQEPEIGHRFQPSVGHPFCEYKEHE